MTRVQVPVTPVRGWPRPRRRYEPTLYAASETRRPSMLPEPWIVGDDWTVFHDEATGSAHRDRLCQVCGEQLGAVVVLMRGHRRRETSGPGCHPRCAVLAARFCPHIVELGDVPIAYRYEGDGLGFDGVDRDTPLDEEPYSDELPVHPSAVAMTRAELRNLAKNDPLGTAGENTKGKT